jgi:uncharacterized protein YbjT (DUF2867 family)
MYTVLGATGNIGSVITRRLLEQGEKVRAVGRHAGKLQPYVQRGAEAFVGNVADEAAMTQALSGVRAAFLMLPPGMTSPDYKAEQEQESDALAAAAKRSGLRYAVHLSSIGAQAPSGTGPILGQHLAEKKLNAIEKLNVLHVRPAYFFENHLAAIGMIQMMGMIGGALKPNMRIPQIATQDIGAFAAERLLKLDFSSKQIHELLGERDLSMDEVAGVIARALGKPDLRYVQFSRDQVELFLVQMGTSPKTASYFIEMFQGMNNGLVAATGPRSGENTTPTSIETFVKDVFIAAYQGKAVGA